jgi:hypothetical protein
MARVQTNPGPAQDLNYFFGEVLDGAAVSLLVLVVVPFCFFTCFLCVLTFDVDVDVDV